MHSKKSFLWVIEHDAYFGESGLEGHLQKIQHHTIQISNLLRPNVERRMRYFNQSGPGTFINDFVTLDDSLRSMQILSQQSRLDDSMIDQIFFNNEAVNVAIERMKSYIFEPSSELRRVLLGKITPVLKVIKQITAMWHPRVSQKPDMDLLAETGGKNATIVTSMSDRDLAIAHVLQSAFGHAGQKCSATSLLILEQEVWDDPKFRRALEDAAASIPTGSAWEPWTIMGPLIRPPGGVNFRALERMFSRIWRSMRSSASR